MRAEERAAALSWATCPGGKGHTPDDGEHAYACGRCNADAIRSAEDDALERAAVLAAPLGRSSGEVRWGIAEHIRSLKTGDSR